MIREEAIKLGFKEVPHFAIGDPIIFDLGRRRNLSFHSVGTPNEMLCICEADDIDEKKITDVVVLHNYDYDGYMTLEKLKLILEVLG